jgi:hypothetical protein
VAQRQTAATTPSSRPSQAPAAVEAQTATKAQTAEETVAPAVVRRALEQAALEPARPGREMPAVVQPSRIRIKVVEVVAQERLVRRARTSQAETVEVDLQAALPGVP